MKKQSKRVTYSDVAAFLLNPKQEKLLNSSDLHEAFNNIYKPSRATYSKSLREALKRTAFFIKEEMRKA